MSTKHNIVIEQGTSFAIQFSLEHSNGDVFDASDYSANASIKKQYETNVNSSIIFDTDISNNVLTISLSPSATEGVKYGRYFYDVLLVNSLETVTLRIVEGIAEIKPQISTWTYTNG